MSSNQSRHDELARICRIADMLCTGHAALRDRYTRRAFILDLLTLAASTWLVALAFVEPRLNIVLTPFGWNSQIWIGTLGISVFFLTLVQIKADWKGRADAHKRTMEIYAELKRGAGYLVSSDDYDEKACQNVFSRYEMASAIGVAIPESEFLAQKQRHLVKVTLSKQLDTHPAACLLWLRLRLWWRDNFKSNE